MKTKYRIIGVCLILLLSVFSFSGCHRSTTISTSTRSTTLTTTQNVPTIIVSDAYNLIQNNPGNTNFIIIDVRTADEFNAGHIAGAINIDYESTQFSTDAGKLDKNKQYLLYCATGIRGAAATQIMLGLGFHDVQNLAGGITAWIQAGHPIAMPTTITSITVATTTATTVITPSSNGLQLTLSVNTTTFSQGESLQINVSEYNTISTTNNVPAENNWGNSGLALGPCKNIFVQPFGILLFQGRFTAQNISQATALEIYPRVPCPLFIRQVTGYLFLPDSINAAVLPGGDVSAPTAMSGEVTITGIFTQGTQSHPLDPGIYTIVAGDEWGAFEFLYVNVE
jgi:rhodanese-related sulfurtransferase